jgi:hypothetical protein
MSVLRKVLCSFIILGLLTANQPAKADSGHEFIMSVTYGTLAGTLLGVASLAFVSKPSDKLQNVARGASLGLYAGILLGLYVIYAVPDENEELNRLLPPEEGASPETRHIPIVYPMFSDTGKIDGAAIQMNVWNF